MREGVQGKGHRDRDRATPGPDRYDARRSDRSGRSRTVGGAVSANTSASPDNRNRRDVAGLALRVWAIAALGSAFRTTVEVDPGQTVVSTGPYNWIRHPSYPGLLLIV